MVIKPLSLAHGSIIITVIGVNERYIRSNYPVTIHGIVASIPFYSLCTSRKLHSFFDLLHQLSMSAFGCAGAGETECRKDKQPLHPCSVSQDVDVRN
jgi:hypothetical protein